MKILVSPSSFGQCGEEPLHLLKKSGFQPVMNPYGRKLREEEVIQLGKDCPGIIAGVEPLNLKVLSVLPELMCISRVGVGLENINLEYAEQRGIVVKNTPQGPTRAVAELTLALTLTLIRKIHLADRNMRQGKWKKEVGSLLYQKKIGIYGLGRIGKLTATLFIALGNEVMACDPVVDRKWLRRHPVKMVEPETLFGCSDIITIHIPKGNNQEPEIGKRLLDLMRKDACLINVARGGVMDEPYLYEMLKSNRIAGAAMDVFEQEPYSGCLTELENTVLTPHLGSYAREGKLKMEIEAVKNLISFFGPQC